MRQISKNFEVSYLIMQTEIDKILFNSFYACYYDKDWSISIMNYVSVEKLDANVKFLHPKGAFCPVFFFWSM